MSVSALIVLVLSVGAITGLFAWCIYRVLITPESSEHLHGFEQELPDKDT